jgi:type II secretory pathway component GspD/PulD (secretin)
MRATLAVLAAVLAGCSGVDRWLEEPPQNSEWSDLKARGRSPILRDPKEEDQDLLGWQKVVQERQEADRARLARQPKVTASFVDLTIRDALFEMSNQTKIPIVVDQTVTGNVTLDLKDVPFESALRLLVFAGGYAYSTDGFAYFVGLPDPNSASYSMLTASRVLPTYLPPKLLVTGLNKAYASYVSFVEGTNKIVLTGPSVILDRLEADLRLLDRPPVQVQIECLVVETKYGNDYDLGLEWTAAQAAVEQRLRSDNDRTTPTLNQLDIVGRLAMTFNILEQRNLATIRSHPKIVTTNGTPAEIRSIVENYVLITQPGVTLFQTNLEIIKAGTILKVTPLVTRNDEIELTLEPEVSDVVGISNQTTGNLPVISRRAVKSTVRLKNNEVLIIGGLYQDSLRDAVKGLPFLKDVPVVNLLAGRQDRREISSELLIFVSPKVIK